MPEISIARLRAFHDQAAAAHAAFIAANDRLRWLRRDAQDATEALRLFRETRHLHEPQMKSVPRPSGKGRMQEVMGDSDRHLRAAETRVAKATEALKAAEAARDGLYERYSLSGGLASRAREYAASLGLLPADMEF